MKKILLVLESEALSNNVLFEVNDVNNLNEPWKYLKRKLKELDYDLKTADNNKIDDCDWIIFVDTRCLGIFEKKVIRRVINYLKKIFKKNIQKERDVYQECIRKNLQNKMVLLLQEGEAVIPYNYSKEYHERFDYVLTWNDDLVDNKKYFKIYPLVANKKPLRNNTSFSQKKLLVNISTKKSSPFPKELYSARKNAILFFEKHCPNDFDLYGGRWDWPTNRWEKRFPILIKKYKSYRGFTNDKISTLSQYKFSLCYENFDGANGYITEKLFDCFVAGTVPIYWGANNISKYIDKNCYIDRKKFKSNTELYIFLKKITEKEYNEFMKNIDNFLNSSNYKKFLQENFVNIIIKTLKITK